MKLFSLGAVLAALMPMAACGGEAPTMQLSDPESGLEAQPKSEPAPELEPAPVACVRRDEVFPGGDRPVCEQLAPLLVGLRGPDVLEVPAGGSIQIPFTMIETSGLGFSTYPSVVASSSLADAEVTETWQLYAILGCQTVDTPIMVSVPTSVPPGTEFEVEGRISSLVSECELAHRRSVRIRVF